MKLNAGKIVLLITFFVFGIVVSMQCKTIYENNKLQADLQIKDEQVIADITAAKQKAKDLLDMIEKNEKAKSEYIQSLANNKTKAELIKTNRKLNLANLVSGLTDVRGAGIVIQMNDAIKTKNSSNSYYSNMQLIIHDSDILKLINDLKIAGAQAISINDERLISTSGIICAGPTMLININKYAVPFVIRAIGNSEKLFAAVENSDRIFLMRRDGLRIDIQKDENVKILKYNYDVMN